MRKSVSEAWAALRRGVVAGFALFAAIALLGVLAPASAAGPALESGHASETVPALWLAERGETDVYVYGTIHALPPGRDWLSPAVEAALTGADLIYFEIRPDDLDPEDMQPLVTRLGFYADDRRLSDLLSDAEWRRLSRIADDLGLQARRLDLMKPWMAGITLAAVTMIRAGFDPQSGVEKALFDVLTAHGATGDTVRSLETVAQQLGFFDAVPEELQLDQIRVFLETYPQGRETIVRLHQAWRAGAEDEVHALMHGEMADYPELYDALIVDRNETWVAYLTESLSGDTDVFVAVGAGHTVGPRSVPRLMAEEGFILTRIE